MDKKKIKSIIVFGCFLILFVTLTIVLWPFISSLSTDVGRENLKEKIDSLGVAGWFLMLGIQVLQVIVAFLPGEPIEIVMGVFYGSIGGLFTCLLGILLGSILVYLLSKYIGKPFVKLFIDVDDLEKITYTDYVGIMMSSITTIINAITYVLIAFVAVSLIVSSIMIGVITLISVQERTKEIGILRAIGASKRNVSTMFNAETVIIGFTSATGFSAGEVTGDCCFLGVISRGKFA